MFGLVGSILARPRPIARDSQGPLHILGKRIVSAGVEDHQPKLLGGFDRHQHAVQRKRLVVDVGVALQFRVHRDQVIGAVHLHAVAGVVDHGDVGVARARRQSRATRAASPAAGRSWREIDDVEAGLLEGCRDHGAVIDRVRKRRHVLIGGIGEHQRHALFGECRLAHQQQRVAEEKPVQFERSGRIPHGAFRDGDPHNTPPIKPAPRRVSQITKCTEASRPWNILSLVTPIRLRFALCQSRFSCPQSGD